MRASQRSQPVEGINVLRWELGNELRELRLRAGKSIADAASALDCSTAKISRMENGQRGASFRDVRDLCRLYGIPAQRRDELINLSRQAAEADKEVTIQGKYATYVALEAKARTVRNYEATFVPGLLQTEEYARMVFTDAGDFEKESEVDARLQVRMDRQKRIWSGDDTLRGHFIIDENVLWRPAGVDAQSRAIREGQVDRLIQATTLDNVKLQIIPYETQFYPGMEGSTIILLDLDEGPKQATTCYLEGIMVELFVRGHSEIATVATKFRRMAEVALSPEETRKFLMKVARGNYEHWTSVPANRADGLREREGLGK